MPDSRQMNKTALVLGSVLSLAVRIIERSQTAVISDDVNGRELTRDDYAGLTGSQVLRHARTGVIPAKTN